MASANVEALHALPYTDSLFKEYLLFRWVCHLLHPSACKVCMSCGNGAGTESSHMLSAAIRPLGGQPLHSCLRAAWLLLPCMQLLSACSCHASCVPRRGFTSTLAAFSTDLANDRGCGFQADAIARAIFSTMVPKLQV